MKSLLFIAVFLMAAAPCLYADADADWQQIEATEKAGPAQEWHTRAEAQAGTLDFLGKQEQALRAFIATYPRDARALEARLHLAHLLATRADLEQNPRERRQSDAILDALETDPAMKGRSADVEFAHISILMQRVDALTGENRDLLLARARAFAAKYPDDHRVAALLAEVASAYEDEPRTARGILGQALPVAGTEEIKSRISDDLKRISMLGRPVSMQWTAVDGRRVDLNDLHGKVILIYFFASWSAPSMLELDWVRQLTAEAGPEILQTVGICLDSDPVAVPALLADHQVTWPVYCDGRQWQGTLIRSLGINELPELWLLDRGGVLRSLDARANAAALIQKAAREPAD